MKTGQKVVNVWSDHKLRRGWWTLGRIHTTSKVNRGEKKTGRTGKTRKPASLKGGPVACGDTEQRGLGGGGKKDLLREEGSQN